MEATSGASHNGHVPKERRLSLAQCHLPAHEPTRTSETSAARRERSKLECCVSSLVTASTGAPVPPPDMRRWLGVRDSSWHVTPQARAEGERPLAGAVSLLGVSQPHPSRRGARVQNARVLRLIPATASAGTPAPRETQDDGLALEAAACTMHHERAPKERGLWTAQCAFVPRRYHAGRPQPARHGANVQQARVLRLIPSDSERRHVCAA